MWSLFTKYIDRFFCKFIWASFSLPAHTSNYHLDVLQQAMSLNCVTSNAVFIFFLHQSKNQIYLLSNQTRWNRFLKIPNTMSLKLAKSRKMWTRRPQLQTCTCQAPLLLSTCLKESWGKIKIVCELAYLLHICSSCFRSPAKSWPIWPVLQQVCLF